MDSRNTEIDDQSTVDGTPEDVAALYLWANLRGAKYRDYSASRREHRAQVRYRAARGLLERELAALVEAEASVARAERAALEAKRGPDWQDEEQTNTSRIAPLRNADDAARLASAERVEAARRAESAARASVLALREEREIAEAHSSALRQELDYEESERRRRQLAGPRPHAPLVGTTAAKPADDHGFRSEGQRDLQQALHQGWQSQRVIETSPIPETSTPIQDEVTFDPDPPHGTADRRSAEPSAKTFATGIEEDASAPAWLTSSQSTARLRSPQTTFQSHKGEAAGGDTLQDSRERLAARWFALKGVFEHAGPELAAWQPRRPANSETSMLVVFSLAGGVGKTSLVATLGRALASQGETVTLVDTTSHGLLGIYFGSSGAGDSAAAPATTEVPAAAISVLIHACTHEADDDRQPGTNWETMIEEVFRNGEGKRRLLLDLSTGSSWLIKPLVDLHPLVLVPIAPDMNSVISLQAVERLFRGFVDSKGQPLLPFYVLNQFDASLPLHLDVREVFRRQLGERLLYSAIRRSPSVAEALADGMTVLDYAPGAAVSRDYRNIADWLRGVSPPVTEESGREGR